MVPHHSILSEGQVLGFNDFTPFHRRWALKSESWISCMESAPQTVLIYWSMDGADFLGVHGFAGYGSERVLTSWSSRRSLSILLTALIAPPPCTTTTTASVTCWKSRFNGNSDCEVGILARKLDLDVNSIPCKSFSQVCICYRKMIDWVEVVELVAMAEGRRFGKRRTVRPGLTVWFSGPWDNLSPLLCSLHKAPQTL